MAINDPEIKISTRVPNETYIKLRDVAFRRNETHQDIVVRAIESELKRIEKPEQPKRRGQ